MQLSLKQNIVNLQKYEKMLKHKIHLMKDTDINNVKKNNPRLFNNIINGIKLEGFFKVK